MTKAVTNGNTPMTTAWRGQFPQDDFAVAALRNLVFDLCNQNGGGHGGSALGMAAIGVALYKYVMRYNPSDSEWFDRDRFVLSNGHAAIFLYALNHLTGFDNWTMEELKGYGSAKTGGYKTICHAHPEIEVPGVEVTTGPLGQGIANAVGLAIASKNLAARYNRPGYDVVNSRIYCMTGDGCLMEGVALEAISLAGSLGLDNLVVIYDNNQITCDGPLDWINTEDVNAKMRASGWHVLEVNENGCYDVQAVVSALGFSKTLKEKPTFINIRTVIGVGTTVAGSHKAHHGAFDAESTAMSKSMIGQDATTMHVIPPTALDYFRERKQHGEAIQAEWNQKIASYENAHPELSSAFSKSRKGDNGTEWLEILQKLDLSQVSREATRDANGLILEKLWAAYPALCGGGADLVNSNKLSYTESDVFHPSVGFGGRYIRYGIREHAMAAISNGLAAYNPGTFVPVTATFLIFYLYAAPGVRMGALSHLPTVHVATHDSFAEGQNGPTHQPVEVDSLFRAMPNLTYIRPCDAEEVAGAWMLALSKTAGPTMLSLGRDPSLSQVPNTNRNKVRLGAYVIREVEEEKKEEEKKEEEKKEEEKKEEEKKEDYHLLTLASCGTNLHHVVTAAESLSRGGIPTRVVSCPSFEHFDGQSQEYRDSVFPRGEDDRRAGRPVVSVEEYVATTWAKYVTASCGMKGYGYSASGQSNYARFGLDAEGIERRVRKYLEDLGGKDARRAGWREI